MSTQIPIQAGIFAIVVDASCPYLSHLNLKVGEKWVVSDSIAGTNFTVESWVLAPFPEDPADPRMIIMPKEDLDTYFTIVVDVETIAKPKKLTCGWETKPKGLRDGPIVVSLRTK